MLTSYALSIEFHIILVIVLMIIQVFYISIIFYKLLPMFMIHVSFIIQVFYISIEFYKLLLMFMNHVSFINIILSLFTCFIYQYRFISFYMFHVCIFQRSKYGKELYVPEGTISVQDSDLYLCFTVCPKQGPCHQPK